MSHLRNHGWNMEVIRYGLSEADSLAADLLRRIDQQRSAVAHLREELSAIIEGFCMEGCCYEGSSYYTPAVTCIEVEGNAMAIDEDVNQTRELLVAFAATAAALKEQFQVPVSVIAIGGDAE